MAAGAKQQWESRMATSCKVEVWTRCLRWRCHASNCSWLREVSGASGSMDAPAFDEWQVFAATAASRQQTEEPSSSSSSLLLPPPAPPLHILKSSQLDAQRLDTELTSMLHSQFMKVFSHFQQHDVARFEPELNALILLLVYTMTVARGQATPGSQLLNLRYRNEWTAGSRTAKGHFGSEGPGPTRGQRVLFGLGYVLLPYLWGRVGQLATQAEWNMRLGGQQRPSGWLASLLGSRAWSVLRGLEATYKVSALANLLVFLSNGMYRSVLERVAGMRLVYKQACMTRVISFEYLNRQLVWQELSEVLLFALPLLDVARLKRMTLALLARLPNPALLLSQRQEEQQQQQAVMGGRAEGGPGMDEGPKGPGVGKEAWPSAPCPVCGSQQLLLPFEALPCRHVFCYYCLRSNCEADVGFACPLDGSRVEAMRRWNRGARA